MIKMATEIELTSFLTKFKHLCNAGFQASLHLNCKDGKATVSLEVDLGSLQCSLSTESSSETSKKKRRSPSYYRRQAVRRKARQELFIGSNSAAVEVAIDNEECDCSRSSENEAEGQVSESDMDSEESIDGTDTQVHTDVIQQCLTSSEAELSKQLKNLILESEKKRNIWDRRKSLPPEPMLKNEDIGIS